MAFEMKNKWPFKQAQRKRELAQNDGTTKIKFFFTLEIVTEVINTKHLRQTNKQKTQKSNRQTNTQTQTSNRQTNTQTQTSDKHTNTQTSSFFWYIWKLKGEWWLSSDTYVVFMTCLLLKLVTEQWIVVHHSKLWFL